MKKTFGVSRHCQPVFSLERFKCAAISLSRGGLKRWSDTGNLFFGAKTYTHGIINLKIRAKARTPRRTDLCMYQFVTYLWQGVLHHIVRVSHDSRWKLAPTTITQRPRSPPLSFSLYLSSYFPLSLRSSCSVSDALPSYIPNARASRSLSLSFSLSLSSEGFSSRERKYPREYRLRENKKARWQVLAAVYSSSSSSTEKEFRDVTSNTFPPSPAGGRSRAYAAAWIACRYCTAFDGSIVSRRVALLGPLALLPLSPAPASSSSPSSSSSSSSSSSLRDVSSPPEVRILMAANYTRVRRFTNTATPRRAMLRAHLANLSLARAV